MNPIDLAIFSSRLNAVCEEMGAVLQHAAFSPNIRDRLDFSCAVFDRQGAMVAQAAHIPVHLGSMAYAMRDIVQPIHWQAGDMIVVNDPYLGGTHLPDVTLIAPVFNTARLCGFVANRAHHADIGSQSPGSMPIASSLEEEGIVISPRHLLRRGVWDDDCLQWILAGLHNSDSARGDFAAQASANRVGVERLQIIIQAMGINYFQQAVGALNDYAQRLAHATLATLPNGDYRFSDLMDDDGVGHTDLAIAVTVRVRDQEVDVDFSDTCSQVAGNINCPLAVAAAAVYYVFRCLMPAYTPACAGSFAPIRITAPRGCLLNAQRPAAVAAGNVETSTRVVDVLLGALAQAIPERIPAASHGSMNNIAIGGYYQGKPWDYYETIGGGMGGGVLYPGQSGVQTHMTNTRNTPVEVLELHYPLRVRRYALRKNSGGDGAHRGGDGIIREFEFLAPTTVTLLTERRRHAPWGLQGGAPGKVGVNRLNQQLLASKVSLQVNPGDRLTVETPGGGGYGKKA
ncbi:MAG: hydantoinase B/oxoprolinase family protein [Gammaproteobacteria bacterium]|nr:hydantoinase B/oxoprolinase family protein [Gammaproteobacteria bacterium]